MEILENFIKENRKGNTVKDFIKKIVNGENLNIGEAEQVMDGITGGQASPAQIASILTALSIKGKQFPN